MRPPLILHDDLFTRGVLVAEMEARMVGACSRCEQVADSPAELDSSGRCNECRP